MAGTRNIAFLVLLSAMITIPQVHMASHLEQPDALIVNKQKAIDGHGNRDDSTALLADDQQLGGADMRDYDLAAWSHAHLESARLHLGFLGRLPLNEKLGLAHLQLAGSSRVFSGAPAQWLDAYICMGDYHLSKKNYTKAQLCYQIGVSQFGKEKNRIAWKLALGGLIQISLDQQNYKLADYFYQEFNAEPLD